MNIVLAPKKEQPKGGYKHPKHLLGYGPKHKSWSIVGGFYEDNKYCISPSSSLYDKSYLNN